MYIADEKRYEKMKYLRCGKSGLLLPRVALGLWHNFGSRDCFDNMKEIETLERPFLAAVAVYIGKTRLIDNFIQF